MQQLLHGKDFHDAAEAVSYHCKFLEGWSLARDYDGTVLCERWAICEHFRKANEGKSAAKQEFSRAGHTAHSTQQTANRNEKAACRNSEALGGRDGWFPSRRNYRTQHTELELPHFCSKRTTLLFFSKKNRELWGVNDPPDPGTQNISFFSEGRESFHQLAFSFFRSRFFDLLSQILLSQIAMSAKCWLCHVLKTQSVVALIYKLETKNFTILYGWWKLTCHCRLVWEKSFIVILSAQTQIKDMGSNFCTFQHASGNLCKCRESK